MAEQTGNNDDGILLLELGIDTNQNEFDQAKELLEDLKDKMSDLTSDFSLAGLLSGLRTAASILKGVVDMWNALEDKAISVTYNTQDYLPYNLTPGERQNIANRVSSSKLAEQFGITPETVLDSLENIITEQRATTKAGKVNDENWTAVYQLADYMNNSAFMKSNLSDMLTFNPSTVVFTGLTDMLADAYRKAYAFPEHSKEREELLQLIKGVENTPYVDAKIGHFESLMTEPNVPIYSQAGNPVSRLISAGIEDEGVYMENLQKKAGVWTSVSSDLDYLRSERKEAFDSMALSAANFFGKTLAIPVEKFTKEFTDLFSGKSMSSIWTQGVFGGRVFKGATGLEFITPSIDIFGSGESVELSTLLSAQKRKAIDKTFSLEQAEKGGADLATLQYLFGVSSNWVEGVRTPTDLISTQLGKYNKDSAIQNELAYFELHRLGQSTYGTDVSLLLNYAVENISAQEEFKYGRKKQYKSPQESKAAVVEQLTDPKSKYYIGSGGFADVYSMLYRTDSFIPAGSHAENEKYFLQTMAKAFENTKMTELRSFYGEDLVPLDRDITNADVKKIGGEWKIELTIKDENTGKESKATYTADQLVQGIKAKY